MLKTIARTIVFLMIIAGLAHPAAAKRVALVIGNGAYEQAIPLKNPRNDADALASVLERLGFEVIKGVDLNRSDFERIVRKFSRAIRGADAALLFYAGHGLQVDGRNYLAPIDASLSDEADLDFETLPLRTVLKQMERETRVNLVFLDACRDNPLARNLARSMGTRSASVGRGLARVDTGVGTMIAFATEPGNVALDGAGANSPFTEALLKHIETPGLDIARLMRRVRKEVLDKTSGRQVPWSNSSLTGDFLFASRQIAVEARPDSNDSPVTPAPSVDNRSVELAYWDSVKDATVPAEIESYLKRFPDGVFAELAALKLKQLRTGNENANASREPAKLTLNATLKAAPNRPSRGWLGVRISNATKDNSSCFGTTTTDGALVENVVPDGAALEAGLRPGDIIESADGKPMAGSRALARHVGAKSPGSVLRLALQRPSQPLSETVKELEQRPAMDAATRYCLGYAYRRGLGAQADATKAFGQFLKAAENGSVAAAYEVGRAYDVAEGTEKNPQEAFRWYREAAYAGNVTAMHNLGRLYDYGNGVSEDDAQAFKWYLKAAQAGHEQAYGDVAIKYQFGNGVAKDLAEAARWWRKDADLGRDFAMLQLAKLYEAGTGVPKDLGEAVRLYRGSMKNGYRRANMNLARLHAEGRGVDRDIAVAVDLAVEALKATDRIASDAQKELTSNATAWPDEFRKELQRRLKTEGVYKGSIDGKFGPGTQRALEALVKK